MKMKERIIKTIQLFSATTLQQMSERKKKMKNEKIISVGEKPAEDVKMKKIIKKVLEREKEFRYDDVRDCRREELECNDFYEISHR